MDTKYEIVDADDSRFFPEFIRWVVERVQGAMDRGFLDPGSEKIADDEEWNSPRTGPIIQIQSFTQCSSNITLFTSTVSVVRHMF